MRRGARRSPPRASRRRRCRSTRRCRRARARAVRLASRPACSRRRPRDRAPRATRPSRPCPRSRPRVRRGCAPAARRCCRRRRRRPRRTSSHRLAPRRCRRRRRRRSAPASRARRARSRRVPLPGRRARRPRPSVTATSRQPRSWTTQVPTGHRSFREATTCPTAPPVSGSPSANGGTYDRVSFIRPRMYGSTETNALRTTTSPSPGSGTLDLGELEVRGHGRAARPGGEPDLPRAQGHGRHPTPIRPLPCVPVAVRRPLRNLSRPLLACRAARRRVGTGERVYERDRGRSPSSPKGARCVVSRSSSRSSPLRSPQGSSTRTGPRPVTSPTSRAPAQAATTTSARRRPRAPSYALDIKLKEPWDDCTEFSVSLGRLPAGSVGLEQREHPRDADDGRELHLLPHGQLEEHAAVREPVALRPEVHDQRQRRRCSAPSSRRARCRTPTSARPTPRPRSPRRTASVSSWTLAGGTLPPGLTLGANGVISGTPTASGLHTFTVQANASPNNDTKQLSIFVVAPLELQALDGKKPPTTGLTAGALLNAPLTTGVKAVGGRGAYTFATTGTLPPGLTLDAATGAITGAGTTAGTYRSTITVTDQTGAKQSLPFSITILPLLDFVKGKTLPQGRVDRFYAAQIPVTGKDARTALFAVAGRIPPGLELNETTRRLEGTLLVPGYLPAARVRLLGDRRPDQQALHDPGPRVTGSLSPARDEPGRARMTSCTPCGDTSSSPARHSSTRTSVTRSCCSGSTATTGRWASSSTAAPRSPSRTRCRRWPRSSARTSSSTSAAPCSPRRSSSSPTSPSPSARASSCSRASGSFPVSSTTPQSSATLHAVRVFAGYAGWGPGQLETELDGGILARLPGRCRRRLHERPDELWSEVLRREGGKYAAARPPPRRSTRQLTHVALET